MVTFSLTSLPTCNFHSFTENLPSQQDKWKSQELFWFLIVFAYIVYLLITMCVVWNATGGNWHPTAHFSKLSDEMDWTLSLSDSGPQVSCSTPLLLCMCLDQFLPDFFFNFYFMCMLTDLTYQTKITSSTVKPGVQ